MDYDSKDLYQRGSKLNLMFSHLLSENHGGEKIQLLEDAADWIEELFHPNPMILLQYRRYRWFLLKIAINAVPIGLLMIPFLDNRNRVIILSILATVPIVLMVMERLIRRTLSNRYDPLMLSIAKEITAHLFHEAIPETLPTLIFMNYYTLWDLPKYPGLMSSILPQDSDQRFNMAIQNILLISDASVDKIVVERCNYVLNSILSCHWVNRTVWLRFVPLEQLLAKFDRYGYGVVMKKLGKKYKRDKNHLIYSE